MITRKSAKQKGRKLVYDTKDQLLQAFPTLSSDDILVPGGSQPGEDLVLSPEARKLFPFAIECKNQEHISIWNALDQAEINALGHIPLLVFKKSYSKTYVSLSFEDFLNIMKCFDIENHKRLL